MNTPPQERCQPTRGALAEFRRAGLPFEFFDAVPGELGCYASHQAAWQRAHDRRKPLIVLEDDFHLLPDFDALLPAKR